MEAILKFNLDDIDDRREHYIAIHAQNLVSLLWELETWLRTEEKYKDRDTIETNEVRCKLNELIEQQCINWEYINQ